MGMVLQVLDDWSEPERQGSGGGVSNIQSGERKPKCALLHSRPQWRVASVYILNAGKARADLPWLLAARWSPSVPERRRMRIHEALTAIHQIQCMFKVPVAALSPSATAHEFSFSRQEANL